MSLDIALLAGSSAAGAISAAVLQRLAGSKSSKRAEKSAGAAKSELASLIFEKSLISEAITRVYEASQQQKIDRLERDRLLLKYKEQLDTLNEKISGLQPVVEYDDLSKVRNSLVSLLENNISALDKKLADLSREGKPAPEIDAQVEKIVSDITRGEQEPEHEPEDKQLTAEEKSIAQLQKEIMQALQRLEQVEMDRD